MKREKIKIKSKSCESRPRPCYRIQPFNRAEPSLSQGPTPSRDRDALLYTAFAHTHLPSNIYALSLSTTTRTVATNNFPNLQSPAPSRVPFQCRTPQTLPQKCSLLVPEFRPRPRNTYSLGLALRFLRPCQAPSNGDFWEQFDYLVLDSDKTNDLLVPGSGTANPHATQGHVFSCGLNPIGCVSPSRVITDIHHLVAFFRIF